jgi:A/G-specific adenine glycosylase
MPKKRADRGPAEEIQLWYRAHHRKLPWRETKDPYKIWVSEVMLQQTTVGAAIPYYIRWLRLFPDVGALSRASLQKLLKAWEGLGYYQRARNLHRAARIICRKHGGSIPDQYEELIALPGVGAYIAAAVLSLAFGKPYPVMDANVRRVGMRLWALPGKVNSQTDGILLEKIKGIFPPRNGGRFNQAMMELGALLCRPRNPGCLRCPLPRFCLAYKWGAQEVIPAPRSRLYNKIDTVVGIISCDGRYLIQKRPPRGLLAGLWEFPGGKREKGETLPEALRRELKEELGVEVRQERLLLKVRHAYTRYQVSLFAFECDLESSPRVRGSVHRWVSLRAIKRYPFPSGSSKVVRFLEDRESGRKKRRPREQ